MQGPARWAITSNDNKSFVDANGIEVAAAPSPDTLSLIDLSVSPPRLTTEIQVPGCVQGPPMSVAITPDETLALVSSSVKYDPADASKLIPDDRISVVDLKASPPRLIATLQGGKQPSGISISRDGKLALVANRAEGSVSVLTIAGQTVTIVDKVVLSDPAKPDQKPSTAHVAISPDGKLALATNDGDHRITLLTINGTTVTATRDFYAGLKPYSVDIASTGKFAVVGNMGFGAGDLDTVSLVDLEAQPPRVVDTATVGMTVEGLKLSPDNSVAVAVAQNGSGKPANFPFHSPNSKLVVLRIDGKTLKKVTEATIGGWAQGATFTSDGRRILVGVMVEKRVEIWDWNGSSLIDSGTRITVSGGPAAIRIADR